MVKLIKNNIIFLFQIIFEKNFKIKTVLKNINQLIFIDIIDIIMKILLVDALKITKNGRKYFAEFEKALY